MDPWQSPTEMSNAVVALKKWWARTGRLATASAISATNSYSENSIQTALEQLHGDDPVRRTVAMTTLVRMGPDALPALRESVKRAEKNSDQRSLGLLEDVRWTILVPDSVEKQGGGFRRVLARGKSSERQAAAERLGHLGREALGSLTEFASDPDPLVVESAIRALSSQGGGDTIPALTMLLKSPDSNLRMTAAQALGHTKSAAAIQPLLAATRSGGLHRALGAGRDTVPRVVVWPRAEGTAGRNHDGIETLPGRPALACPRVCGGNCREAKRWETDQ